MIVTSMWAKLTYVIAAAVELEFLGLAKKVIQKFLMFSRQKVSEATPFEGKEIKDCGGRCKEGCELFCC